MANMKELNTLNFHDSIENGISLVKFWTTWCGPCKVYSPIFDEFAEENKDINCFSVDAGSEEDLVSEFNLISVPMTLLFKDGKHVKSQNGILKKEQLMDLIKSC